ncbi:hypothetical protein NQ318_008287 [Aromia moschata]|uniref:Uncharacterized protein n=1 Tax=Aromia moschata TaxID=1265417 RepID=A0AAV8XFJ2_9CUCU|nr:hypothetical protein NQ318_008287 [Aromia moschata]
MYPVKVFLFSVCLVLVSAEEPTVTEPTTTEAVTAEFVTIVSQENTILPSGDFRWGFVAGNGIKVQQEGNTKALNETADEETFQGSYEYVGDDQKVYKVSYVADERGYRPEGAHIPTIPPLIQRALRYLATVSPSNSTNYYRHSEHQQVKYSSHYEDCIQDAAAGWSDQEEEDST